MSAPNSPQDDLFDLFGDLANGAITQEGFERLARRLADDPEARRAYVGYMDLHAELAARAIAPGVPVTGAIASLSGPQTRLFRVRRVVAWAAVALLAAAGWAVALVAILCPKAARQEPAGIPQPVAQAKPDRPATAEARTPEIISTRGLVLAFAEGTDDAEPMHAGSHAPLGRRLWTCPWGAADLRYGDGATVALDRSTVASLSEEAGVRRVRLDRGILFLQSVPPTAGGGRAVVRTPQAEVHVANAQVAVVVEARQTLVEVAQGSVEVVLLGDEPRQTCSVSLGHYLIAESGKPLRAVKGRLGWQLKP